MASCQAAYRFAAKAKSGHSPEDVPTGAIGTPPNGKAGLCHTAGQQEVLGLAILPMIHPQTPPFRQPTPVDTLLGDSLPQPPAAAANTSSQAQHSSGTAQLQSDSSMNDDVIGNRRLWLLPLTMLQENEAADLAHEDGSGPPAEQCRTLLKHLLSGISSTVCFDLQGQHSCMCVCMLTIHLPDETTYRQVELVGKMIDISVLHGVWLHERAVMVAEQHIP